MGGMASGAYFLVSPMLAVGQPLDAPPAIADPMPAPQGRLGVVPIVAFLPTVPPEGKTMGSIVVEQVRRQLEERPEPVASIWQDDGVAGDGDDREDPRDHDAAVVAAHEQRIVVLRERLAAMRSRRIASPVVTDLRQRLHRAEAARLLAVTRADAHRSIAVAALGGGDALAGAGGPTRLAATALAGPARTATGIGRSPHGLGRSPGSAADAPSTRRLLAHARQSLADARTALEPGGGRPQRAEATPRIVIAGLLQWAGSDRWSLPAAERLA